jgi:hypothetical protein
MALVSIYSAGKFINPVSINHAILNVVALIFGAGLILLVAVVWLADRKVNKKIITVLLLAQSALIFFPLLAGVRFFNFFGSVNWH